MQVCKFLEVSKLSFKPEYGPKLAEGFVRVKHLQIIRSTEDSSCCFCCGMMCRCNDNWQKVVSLEHLTLLYHISRSKGNRHPLVNKYLMWKWLHKASLTKHYVPCILCTIFIPKALSAFEVHPNLFYFDSLICFVRSCAYNRAFSSKSNTMFPNLICHKHSHLDITIMHTKKFIDYLIEQCKCFHTFILITSMPMLFNLRSRPFKSWKSNFL